MKISATDLARYMTMHLNFGKYKGGRILRKKSAQLMQQSVSPEGYGLAIMTRDSLVVGHVMKGHTGSAYGLYSTMFFDPKKKFGIVAITNGSKDGPDVLNTVVRCLYTSLIE